MGRRGRNESSELFCGVKFLVLGKGRQMPLAALLISCSPSRINLENQQDVRQVALVASSIGAGQFPRPQVMNSASALSSW
jgi:hypothetical protein